LNRLQPIISATRASQPVVVTKIDPNDMLSAEELAEMERTQSFD
jgi:hypothetical protein